MQHVTYLRLICASSILYHVPDGQDIVVGESTWWYVGDPQPILSSMKCNTENNDKCIIQCTGWKMIANSYDCVRVSDSRKWSSQSSVSCDLHFQVLHEINTTPGSRASSRGYMCMTGSLEIHGPPIQIACRHLHHLSSHDDYRLYHESCDEIVESAGGMGSSGSSHQYHDLKISSFRVVWSGLVHPLKLGLMHVITSRILCGGGGSNSLNSVTVMMIWSDSVMIYNLHLTSRHQFLILLDQRRANERECKKGYDYRH